MSIRIYTDWSSIWNPWPGGRAAIILRDGEEQSLSWFQAQTTNNQMELLAVIQALLTLIVEKNPSFLLEEVTTWLGGSGSGLFENEKVGPQKVIIDEKISLSTDSEYVQKGVSEWMETRVRRGWRRSKWWKTIENVALRQQMHALLPYFSNLEWKWVKWHAGDPMNERVDELARGAALGVL